MTFYTTNSVQDDEAEVSQPTGDTWWDTQVLDIDIATAYTYARSHTPDPIKLGQSCKTSLVSTSGPKRSARYFSRAHIMHGLTYLCVCVRGIVVV